MDRLEPAKGKGPGTKEAWTIAPTLRSASCVAVICWQRFTGSTTAHASTRRRAIMPARTGAEYIARLRECPPDIHMQGQRVKDVTIHPGLRNGVQTLARLYDMQHDPALRQDMTY